MLVDNRADPPGIGVRVGDRPQARDAARHRHAVACALMKRLAKLDVPTVVVAQYDFYVWMDAAFGIWPSSAGSRRAVAEMQPRRPDLSTVDLYDQTKKGRAHRGPQQDLPHLDIPAREIPPDP